jgi:hypothetical protein
MRCVLRIHFHSYAGCTRLTLSVGGEKTTYMHEGPLHLPTTAHLPCFTVFEEKNHVRYFLNRPRMTDTAGKLLQFLCLFCLPSGIMTDSFHDWGNYFRVDKFMDPRTYFLPPYLKQFCWHLINIW